ncbi:MAG: DNA repair protein RadC [Cyclobacteriaceae bacterium]|jgi:DNA repair protein RadC|nr:DNA repair protein RadC [Cytophagales bacterium]MCZ8329571.1 DNA repair protein RadC [Cyclobacteriaceae bacterium]
MDEHGSLTIKQWALEDRPREKMLLKGIAALSDAELLAILITTGSGKQSALDLARAVLNLSHNNLDQLAKLSIKEYTKVKGIGQAKAIILAAAMELGRRRKISEPEKKIAIHSSRDIFDLMGPYLMDLPHEEFWIVLANRANKVIKREKISSGGVAGTVADPKLIFKKCLDELASVLIIVHNHPSGNLQPSQADKELTNKIKAGASLLDIKLLDHIIVAHKKYFSFADEGLL